MRVIYDKFTFRVPDQPVSREEFTRLQGTEPSRLEASWRTWIEERRKALQASYPIHSRFLYPALGFSVLGVLFVVFSAKGGAGSDFLVALVTIMTVPGILLLLFGGMSYHFSRHSFDNSADDYLDWQRRHQALLERATSYGEYTQKFEAIFRK